MSGAVGQLLADQRVRAALDFIRDNEPQVIQLQKELTLLEAPTFHEEQRGRRVLRLFQEAGLAQAGADDMGNVTGLRLGRLGDRSDTVAIEAHMDTVFPKGTVNRVLEREGILYAPGISDNTRGLALLWGVLEALRAGGLQTKRDILFAATVQEEGLGGLSGLRHLLDSHGEVRQCITVDGPDADVVVTGGPGIRTLEVTFSGAGGHAYKHCGEIGNPAHAAARAAAAMLRLPLPKAPKTTFEVTVLDSGGMSGVNAIPASARMVLNYRSSSMEALLRLDESIRAAAEAAAADENASVSEGTVEVQLRLLTDVPAASQPADSPMASTMADVIRQLGMEPVIDTACPTNANMSIGRGIEGICIGGGGRAGLNHSLGEWFDPKDSYLGVQAALLELLLLAGLA